MHSLSARRTEPKRHVMKTDLLSPTPAGLARAAALLREGQLVAMPTETVYGLAADARADRAVAEIFAAKGRPRFNPLIVHLADPAQVPQIAEVTPHVARLAPMWPGPLTLVLPLRRGAGLSPLVTAGHDTVALRLPAHPVARALLRAFGGPLAAPSANPSGRISPTTPAHVLAGLGGRIAAVLDGGACGVGVESTILDATGARLRLLRAGGVPPGQIEALTGETLDRAAVTDDHAPSAPGQMSSHYAPRGRVRLGVTRPEAGEIWIGFGAQGAQNGLNLSPAGDLTEAAARLFATLHRADALAGDAGRIAIAPVPETGLGLAINDRLRRAAAPRPDDPRST
jgi:L-threonylcarbamoyladenylate synthase